MPTSEEQFVSGNVVSADGTMIGYRVIGKGPGLVIVHGTARKGENYEVLARELAGRFTVYVMDRRGRGGSGPQGEAYSLRKEREDVVALLTEAQASLLFGHSFGGLVALEVALAYPLRKLTLYDPAVSIDGSIPMGWLSAFEEALARQDPAKAFTLFLRGLGFDDIPDDHLEAIRQEMKQHPGQFDMVDLLPTIANELREVARADSAIASYAGISAETLLLLGAESPGYFQAARALESVMPHFYTRILPGLKHNAPDMNAPEQVARELEVFFLKTASTCSTTTDQSSSAGPDKWGTKL
ncbi:alpha/beta hydrolase [Paenibacillus sp. KQZ6P-2]|uniref:Alpha/beta hydrolase n=1 Tax=Paenibacillus mangrovi TaxID=2931978 RepID=A0A9X1WNR1_9BACL|nr:alpha/beta hydrolase [Paenibacillus mangrovi]MCJ8010415.1 alpha/beta hydrolase [Paenibacillus mangrovi]